MSTTGNAAATLKRAQDFAADFANSSLSFGDGTTTAVTHTVTSWTTANDGQDAVATVDVIDSDVTIANDVNPVDEAVLTKAGRTYTLDVGETGSGATVEVSTTNFIAGQPSNVTSFSMRFPAIG